MPITREQYLELLGRLEGSKLRAHPPLTAQGPDDLSASLGEKGLQDRIIEDTKSRGWWALFSRMDRKTTTPLGTPDLIIFADHGRVIICEAKSRSGKLRPRQLAVKAMLEMLGHKVFVIYSFQDYLSAIA